MKTLTVLTLKTPALNGMLYTMRYSLDGVCLGQFQAVSPEVYETPFTPIGEAIYVDIQPSMDRGMRVASDFMAQALSHGLSQAQISPFILHELHNVLDNMEGVHHLSVMSDEFSKVKQYQFTDAHFFQMWQALKDFQPPT
ncbi:MAG: hypothetical protein OSB62_04450 [Alphaproteobacteria bacterium]|nr:hypothetical protein [Alphaproteobacteria bacterium]